MTNRILHICLMVALSSCAGGADSVGRVQATLLSSSVPTGGSGGTVMIAPHLGVKEIIVSIDKVTAHSSSAGWVTLSGDDVTVDILRLGQYGQQLGFANIPAGKVTQLRLYVKEGGTQYVTRDDGVRVDLKVPSGLQSGIKLHGMFDVNGCQSSNVPLQWDGKRSIWVHDTGQGDLWILRPVIRTGKIDVTDTCTPGGGGGTPGGSTPGGGTPGGEIPGEGGGTPGTGGGGGADVPGGITEIPGSGMGGAGTPCATSSACLSGVCVNNVCGAGGPDAPCAVAADCASGVCTTGACGPGSAVGPGVPCTVNTQCLSNACVNGACEPGGQGQPCANSADCLGGYSCSAGYCQPPIN